MPDLLPVVRAVAGREPGHKQYCSGACRVRATRQRQAEALAMHGKGTAVDVIAAALETDAETVERWVANKKRE